MRRIALLSLFHDRSKLCASMAGVIFASVLVYTQLGLYSGFTYSVAMLVGRVGGDVWVMARGTETVDYGEDLSPGSRSVADRHPCVERVRPLLFSKSEFRTAAGPWTLVRIIGVDPAPRQVVPWELRDGLPADVLDTMRISVDSTDLAKLKLPDSPVGTRVEVGKQTVTVAAVTRGIHSSSTIPYLFMNIDTARRLSGTPAGVANFWVLDVRDPACVDDVIASVSAVPGLQAVRRTDFYEQTESWWLHTTGVGAVLTFVAILALIVGGVIVGQTLYTLVRDHERELATLRAVGASRAELAGFVIWQAGLLAGTGISIGYYVSGIIRDVFHGTSLTVILPPNGALLGTSALVVMCVAASVLGVRRVLSLDPATVFA